MLGLEVNEQTNLPDVPLDFMVGTFPDVWWILSTVLVIVLLGVIILFLQRVIDLLYVVKESLFVMTVGFKQEEPKPKKRKS